METSPEFIVLSDDEEDQSGPLDLSVVVVTEKREQNNDTPCPALGQDQDKVVTCDEDDQGGLLDASVVVVEGKREQNNDEPCPAEGLDQDLVVTFCQQAPVLPHARFDCPIHPFSATDEVCAPAADNCRTCAQCFCYVCDKLASACPQWSLRGTCHCNSHKKSPFWSQIRSGLLLGRLQDFGLSLSHVDQHLRDAESKLQTFRAKLAADFANYQKGCVVPGSGESTQVMYDYTPVYQSVSWFLNLADAQEGRAAAVMRLGAAQDFLPHFQCHSSSVHQSPMVTVSQAKVLLLTRIVGAVQRQMVMGELTSEFSLKLQDFYSKLPFSPDVKPLRSRLSVRLWDDVLLGMVLKGQNVQGVRRDRGRKDVLLEDMSVVLLRLELLQGQQRYRELQRYLRAVQAANRNFLQQLQDLVPYFMCLDKDLSGALGSLLGSNSGPVSRLSPDLFLVYFRIFEEAKVPRLLLQPPDRVRFVQDSWKTITGVAPIKKPMLVKFALRVFGCRPTVFGSSQCWTRLLRFVTRSSPPVPHMDFLQDADSIVSSLLLEFPDLNLPVPQLFQPAFPDQSLLLLVTGVLGLRLMQGPLRPLLPVLATYQGSPWAFLWLLHRLSSSPEHLAFFQSEVSDELSRSTDASCFFLFSILSSLPRLTHPSGQAGHC